MLHLYIKLDVQFPLAVFNFQSFLIASDLLGHIYLPKRLYELKIFQSFLIASLFPLFHYIEYIDHYLSVFSYCFIVFCVKYGLEKFGFERNFQSFLIASHNSLHISQYLDIQKVQLFQSFLIASYRIEMIIETPISFEDLSVFSYCFISASTMVLPVLLSSIITFSLFLLLHRYTIVFEGTLLRSSKLSVFSYCFS